jgi:hypothetical protein
MSKKYVVSSQKLNLSIPEISKEMIFCMNNNVIVYPIEKNKKWFIRVDQNDEQIFLKETEKDKIQYNIYKSWIFYYNKLKEIENGRNTKK